jgi:hypothetical protein
MEFIWVPTEHAWGVIRDWFVSCAKDTLCSVKESSEDVKQAFSALKGNLS